MLPALPSNIILITASIAMITTMSIGTLVYYTNKKSITHKSFLLFSLAATEWNFFNFINTQFSSEVFVLWALRMVMFSAVLYTFFLFKLFYVFPKENVIFPKYYRRLILPAVVATLLITLTPLVFPGIEELAPIGYVSNAKQGPGLGLFGLVVGSLIFFSIFTLGKKAIKVTPLERPAYLYILIGAFITFTLHFLFNFLFPVVLDDQSFILLGAVFTFPLIIFTAYALIRHNLFNAKVILTEILTFTAWIFILIRALITDSTEERILNFILLIVMVLLGVILNRSVRKEVHQKEQLGVANKQLERLNLEKSEFLSLASHQLKHSPTIVRNYASLIEEGSYGQVSDKVKEVVGHMAETAQEQLVIIEDFLNISRLEQGRMKYDFGPLAMDKLVTELADEFKEIAKEHQTELTHEIKGTGPFTIRADYGKIKQVITNLVNNAVEKYAMGKKVHLSLESLGEGKGIRFTVSDTGLGMSKETIARLFKRFSRAKDIGDKAVASEGSGLGLFIAREMVLAHGGRIWAESAGEGKGSVFFLELPSVPVENSAQKFEEEDKKEEEK